MKLKILPLSMRRKKRYIAFRVISNCDISYEEVKQKIREAVVEIFGKKGYADIHPRFIDNLWNDEKKIGVIRCWHKEVYRLVFAIGSAKFNCEAVVKILKVSGTIKKIKTSVLNKL